LRIQLKHCFRGVRRWVIVGALVSAGFTGFTRSQVLSQLCRFVFAMFIEF